MYNKLDISGLVQSKLKLKIQNFKQKTENSLTNYIQNIKIRAISKESVKNGREIIDNLMDWNSPIEKGGRK